jgi:hypothetical protein
MKYGTGKPQYSLKTSEVQITQLEARNYYASLCLRRVREQTQQYWNILLDAQALKLSTQV